LRDAVRRSSNRKAGGDAVARLGSLNAPTADIEQVLAEIDTGRS
jgi:hypothetical protein